MFSRVSRGVSWFLRIGTLSNAYESPNVAQVAKKSISGPSGRRGSAVLNSARRVSMVAATTPRRASLPTPPSGTRAASTIPEKLRLNYEKFQMDNGVPVYLKGGPLDRLLFGLTLILISIGLLDGLFTIYKMAYPKKVKN